MNLSDLQVLLTEQMHQHLRCYDVTPEELPPTPQVRATVPMIAALMADYPRSEQLAWVLYALVVNVTDALLDCPHPDAGDVDVLTALAHGDPPTNPKHLLVRLLDAAYAALPSSVASPAIQQWLQTFFSAQLSPQQSADSYLAYVENRIIAQGVPLLFQIAALLIDPDALNDPHLPQRMRLAGTITALTNDLASYEQEVREGVAAYANARGVLATITGLPAQHPALSRLIAADIRDAQRRLDTILRQHAPLDQLIVRTTTLVTHARSHHGEEVS